MPHWGLLGLSGEQKNAKEQEEIQGCEQSICLVLVYIVYTDIVTCFKPNCAILVRFGKIIGSNGCISSDFGKTQKKKKKKMS